ncbi:LysR family transcriptional regulator [Testudinibacter sp. TR-2022]|uniref:LysR family transcriptional regulator n=1 Tax=Testudinibacter sp. TR-2022 TaxID=2585029 RepID=UPI00111A277C|nr:LysR family transcriptional regulator [Testudinibacter sp. TR-2022]TNH05142.1 LysR family transcriptional regulator [Pasteurellaceae bacterium Phil31]TNH09680.1 LysR family transcriptional regulator [Testudinibacter sp. TR-2022]TNH11166.1 LysR family transcriptional regulator [Testudinibacter sp. TR-2022]TNH14938.1 LysR family transcriptional regulator [Testudinibacter sp. TR-2022]TNH20387.1 LysR family transcriptional regulator [Testudinibacter sp. TR-2022]
MQEIKPLLVLAAVLQYGSMNEAAKVLNMTPSAVSQHIAKLEQRHKVKLLHRSTRRLTPTDAGRELQQYCLRLQYALGDTLQALDNLKVEAAGELNIALPSGMASAPAFQQALKKLHQDYPEIQPVLHFSDSLADLKQGNIDIALRGGEHALQAPDLIARPLAEWRWLICAAPDYLAAREPIQRPEQLLAQHWLHYLPIKRIPMRFERESYVLEIADSLHCNQISAVYQLTLAGVGLSMQLNGEVATPLAQGQLQVVLPQWQLPALTIYAVTSYRVQSAKTEVALKILQHYFADGLPRGESAV